MTDPYVWYINGNIGIYGLPFTINKNPKCQHMYHTWILPMGNSPWLDFISHLLDDVPKSKEHLVGGWATPLKNMSQLGWLFPVYGKIKHVPNHQPGILTSGFSSLPRLVTGSRDHRWSGRLNGRFEGAICSKMIIMLSTWFSKMEHDGYWTNTDVC